MEIGRHFCLRTLNTIINCLIVFIFHILCSWALKINMYYLIPTTTTKNLSQLARDNITIWEMTSAFEVYNLAKKKKEIENVTCKELVLQLTWKQHNNYFTQMVWLLLSNTVLGHQVWYNLENGKGHQPKGLRKAFACETNLKSIIQI